MLNTMRMIQHAAPMPAMNAGCFTTSEICCDRGFWGSDGDSVMRPEASGRGVGGRWRKRWGWRWRKEGGEEEEKKMEEEEVVEDRGRRVEEVEEEEEE